MTVKKFNLIQSLLFLTLVVCSQSAFSAKIFRWTDASGNVKFSDQIPPNQVVHRREELNHNAHVVGVVEKAKTKAQLNLEKRLAKLRKQQDKIIKQQKIKDKVLLGTYRNIDDMESILEGKLLTLDGQRKIILGNLKGLENQLKKQQELAAQFDRDGKIIPLHLSEKIQSSQNQVTLIKQEILNQFEKKKNIRKKLEKDIDRFVFLTESKKVNKDVSRETAEDLIEFELGVYICKTRKVCELAWGYAKQFVYNYSTTEFYIENEQLIMSQEPKTAHDYSLSVSNQVMDKHRQQLFLDIRCHESPIGKELCSGEKIKKIRRLFSGYIKTALNTELKETIPE